MNIQFSESQGQIHFCLTMGSAQVQEKHFAMPSRACVGKSRAVAKKILAEKVSQLFSKENAFQEVFIHNSKNSFQIRLTSEQQDPSPLIAYQLERIVQCAFTTVATNSIDKSNAELAFLASLRGSKSGLLHPDVYEFFKRVTTAELKDLIGVLQRVAKSPKMRYDQMLARCRSVKLTSDPDLPYFALLAFAKGDLNVMELSQVLLIVECMHVRNKRSVEVFTLKNKQNVERVLESVDTLLTEEQKGTLRKKLPLLPISEGCFTVLDAPYVITEDLTYDEKARTNLFILFDEGFDHTLFLTVPNRDSYRQFVISPRIAYEICKVMNGPLAMRPNLVIGYSKREDFSYPERRDIFTPCPKVSTPSTLHELDATAMGMYHHDIAYHYFVDSANPHREAWIELARHANKKFKELAVAIEDLLDRDFMFYIYPKLAKKLFKSDKYEKSTLFWCTFVNHLCTKMTSRSELRLSLHLLTHIWQARGEWKKRYGIDCQDVFSLRATTQEELQLLYDHQMLSYPRFLPAIRLQKGVDLLKKCFQHMQTLPADFDPESHDEFLDYYDTYAKLEAEEITDTGAGPQN